MGDYQEKSRYLLPPPQAWTMKRRLETAEGGIKPAQIVETNDLFAE
jgi:hypothetical protein